MAKYSSEEYFEFIEKFTPKFDRMEIVEQGKFIKSEQIEMFTIPTQHIYSTSAEDLLNRGIETSILTNGKSPFGYFMEQLENSNL